MEDFHEICVMFPKISNSIEYTKLDVSNLSIPNYIAITDSKTDCETSWKLVFKILNCKQIRLANRMFILNNAE